MASMAAWSALGLLVLVPLMDTDFTFLPGAALCSLEPPCVAAGGGRALRLGMAEVLGREGGAGVSIQKSIIFSI